jgi:uroporphyrinogen III methyltransferase / synthase
MKKGRVYLVGAGPGDPGLLTRKAEQLLSQADVVIYDRLVSKEILSYIPGTAEQIYVGKENTGGGKTQGAIHRILLESARKYTTVVRLKGGDPFVFGRGGEEACFLAQAGINVEIVPGITSAVAACSYAGIPVTHRDESSGFHVFTGSGKENQIPADLSVAAQLKGTLIFLMPIRNLATILQGLMDGGMNRKTPAALIRHGTRTSQKILVSTLGNMMNDLKTTPMTPPSLLVVGNVVNLRKQIAWFEKKPLFGTRVLVTRAQGQNRDFARLLEQAGASALCEPFIQISGYEETPFSLDPPGYIAGFRVLLFNSRNGVDFFFRALAAGGYDARILGGKLIGAVGTGTGKALLDRGIRPDFIPGEYRVQALAALAAEKAAPGDRLLFITGNLSPVDCPALEKRWGLFFEKLILYETGKARVGEERIQTLVESGIDYITFMSSSTVDAAADLLETCPGSVQQAFKAIHTLSIGPETSARLRERGFKVTLQTQTYTMEGMIHTLITNRHGGVL